MGNARVPECLIVERAVEYFADRHFATWVEVPTMGKSADVVARGGRYIYMTEAKVSDWRRGLEQAYHHLLVADFVLLAIGTRAVSSELCSRAHELGVGVLHIDQACTLVLKPKQSLRIWKPQRSEFLRVLRGIANVS